MLYPNSIFLHIKYSDILDIFPSLKIRNITRETNLVADKLARGARSSTSAVFYVDSIPPVWLSEPQLFNFVFVVKKSYGV